MSPHRLRQTLFAAVIVGYALLDHYSNSIHAPPALGATLAIAPLWLALLLLTRRARRPGTVLLLYLLASGALLAGLWPELERHFAALSLVQQCGVYLALAVTFGRSLLPGQQPLCTRWAAMIHGALPHEVLSYTRVVTAAWTAFFALIVVLSATLYVTVSRSAWSLFSNFAVLPLVALMFAAELHVRRRQLPRMPRVTLAQTLRVYLADQGGAHGL